MIMELRMYKYRLYPSYKQGIRLINSLKICKTIYNELLETSINTYKESGRTLRKFDYNNLIKGKYLIHSQAAQNVSDRVHKSFSNFFRRVKDKSCKKKGFPRFKSSIRSITYPQSGFKFMNERKLKVSKVGNLPIILHRAPKGKIKTMTIKRNKANQWFAVFSCELPDIKIIHPSKDKIGIDVGIENFAALSDGTKIENPRYLIKSEKRLSRLCRRMSKRKKGSKNRFKARIRIARQYNRISNQRLDFLHKLSNTLANKYSSIAVENLVIRNMVKNHHLAKHINDASWNSFMQMLSYKAIRSGGQLIKVNPRNTSKACSNCGTIIEMSLSKRKFRCSHCGFVCHRDLNASINIHDRAGLARISTPVGDTVRPSLKARVVESGTICSESQFQ